MSTHHLFLLLCLKITFVVPFNKLRKVDLGQLVGVATAIAQDQVRQCSANSMCSVLVGATTHNISYFPCKNIETLQKYGLTKEIATLKPCTNNDNIKDDSNVIQSQSSRET